jgi:hypothetical protein
MRYQTTSLLAMAMLTLITWANPMHAQTDPVEPKPEQKEMRESRFPFRGKLSEINQKEMTIALVGKEKKRMIHLNKETRITRDGKPAKLSDAVVGEEVGGLLMRTAQGKEHAVSLRLGAKPEEKEKKEKAPIKAGKRTTD